MIIQQRSLNRTGSVPAPFVRTQFQEDISVEGPRLDFLLIIQRGTAHIYPTTETSRTDCLWDQPMDADSVLKMVCKMATIG